MANTPIPNDKRSARIAIDFGERIVTPLTLSHNRRHPVSSQRKRYVGYYSTTQYYLLQQ